MMKKILTNTLVVVMILSNLGMLAPSLAFAENVSENESSNLEKDVVESKYSNDDCDSKNGYSLDIYEAAEAFNAGLISFNLATNTSNTVATLFVSNKTNCKFPVSLSAYKMYDGVLSHQEFFDGTGLVYVKGDAEISIDLPKCMAQIDAWYGLHPTQLLDSNPYGYPNVPMVIAYKFLYNSGTGYHDPIGPLCKKEVPNTAPVITLVGSSTVNIVEGNIYTDLGATAQDLEDGNITANIIASSTVNINVPGTYTVTYNVVDSGGLHAVQVTRTVIVTAKPIETKTATISATKIVCKSESDLPNWGAGGPDISSTTATTYVQNNSNCKIVPWTFEYDDAIENPGDHVTVAGNGWTPFQYSTPVEVTTKKIWVREQFDSNYINFSGLNTTQNVSAEIYCDTDVLNYDNYDWLVPSVKGKTYYCVAWNVLKEVAPVNTPPVITLIGANPASVNVGQNFIDPGATAQDLEDGNITANIIASSTVNINVPGTYTVTYNVVDSGGLHAVQVSRTVNVLEVIPENRGKITFCLVLADTDNVIATSSYSLPQGTFTMNLASTSINSSSTIQSKTWDSSTFSPNRRVILGQNDAECVTYDNLPYGSYNYSTLTINGQSWNTAIYNDQSTQPVNSIFDLFQYGTSSVNSDGAITLSSERYERTLVVATKYTKNNQCLLPEITSALNASVTVNNQFSYSFTASSTDAVVLSVSTTTLPAWLSFATTTNTISGTPTQIGTYNVDLLATNLCGFDSKTLVISVVAGGGGGGGGSPTSDLSVIKTADKSVVNAGDTITYSIKVLNAGPNNATQVSLTDVLPSTLTFVSSTSTLGAYSTTTGVWTIGDLLNNASTTLTLIATVNSGTEGQSIINTATTTSAQTDPNGGNNTSTVSTTVNPAPCTSNCGGGGGGGGGGNGPISTSVPNNSSNPTTPTVPNSCYYLIDYLRKDFNNNPVEVKKLQVFLRDLEGFTTVQVTGLYDDQTIVALNAFQERYKGDILTPWGHTEPTSYTYILTKKKVNEIYCKMAFPVNAQQQAEIDTYRNFLQGLRDSGIEFTGDVPVQNPSNWVIKGEVGTISTTSTSNIANNNVGKGNLATLAGYSSTTQNLVSNLTANVISSAKQFANTLLGLFSWPFGSDSKENLQCEAGFSGIGWLNWILILIILVISYLWYREYKNNKKIEEINKVIDLE